MRRKVAVHISLATRVDQPKYLQGSLVLRSHIIYAGTCSRLTSGQPMQPMRPLFISRTLLSLAIFSLYVSP